MEQRVGHTLNCKIFRNVQLKCLVSSPIPAHLVQVMLVRWVAAIINPLMSRHLSSRSSVKLILPPHQLGNCLAFIFAVCQSIVCLWNFFKSYSLVCKNLCFLPSPDWCRMIEMKCGGSTHRLALKPSGDWLAQDTHTQDRPPLFRSWIFVRVLLFVWGLPLSLSCSSLKTIRMIFGPECPQVKAKRLLSLLCRPRLVLQ